MGYCISMVRVLFNATCQAFSMTQRLFDQASRIADGTRQWRDLVASRLKQSCFTTTLLVKRLDIKSIVLRPWPVCLRKWSRESDAGRSRVIGNKVNVFANDLIFTIVLEIISFKLCDWSEWSPERSKTGRPRPLYPKFPVSKLASGIANVPAYVL